MEIEGEGDGKETGNDKKPFPVNIHEVPDN